VPRTDGFGSVSKRPKNIRIRIQTQQHWCKIMKKDFEFIFLVDIALCSVVNLNYLPPRFRGQEERETSPPEAGAEDRPGAVCRLSVERQIPGDDSGGAGLPALLTVDTEFIREQTPGRTQFCVSRSSVECSTVEATWNYCNNAS
jgi:hypothetical protein